MSNCVLPTCLRIFEAHPTCQAIVFSVAQYWADEADDAVHDRFTLTTTPDPVWPRCLDDHEANFADVGAYAYQNDLYGLDDNSTMITAFASYCSETTNQESDYSESYTPYAIIRRAGDSAAVEIVGVMHRPDWEDAADVGYADEEE